MIIIVRSMSATLVLGAAALSVSGPRAEAQQSPPSAERASDSPTLETIEVTAQKRPERLQDVPIAIAAFNAASLEQSGITSVSDLGTVIPGLIYTDVVGYGLPYLRGIGTTATGPGFENPVATYVDGVYYASQGGAALSFNNIASVEVDKGPQGTLFGRNTTGGAIQINTLKPSQQFGGVAEVGYGNYNTIASRLYVTGGVTSTMAADLAVSYSDQGKGYAVNLANGADVDKTDNLALRSKLVYAPSDVNELTLIADYSRLALIPTLAPAPGTTPQFDPPVSSNPRDVYGRPQPYTHTVQWGVSANYVHHLDFATLSSISAYRSTFFDSQFDSTLTALPGSTFFVAGHEPHRQASQEFQLASNSAGPIDWVSGLYLYWERAGFNEPTTIGGESFASQGFPLGIAQGTDYKTYSAALYGQGTYRLTSADAITLGLRLTDEYKNDTSFNNIPDFGIFQSFANDRNYSNVSWRMAAQHTFQTDSMAYVSYNRGFKSGGYNLGTPFQPERLDALELGSKQEFFSRRVRLNTALFYYRYDNIQTVTYPNGSQIIGNGAAARLYGLDLDVEMAVTSNLKFSSGVEWLRSKYTSYPTAATSVACPISPTPATIPAGCLELFPGDPTTFVPGGSTYLNQGGATGNRLPKAPTVSASIAADYTQDTSIGRLASNLTYSYDSGRNAESDGRLRQPAYGTLNAFVSVETPDHLTIKAWGKNLTDRLYAAFLASQTNGDFVEWSPPRTYGVTVSKKF